MMNQEIEMWIKELTEAGWKQVLHNIWKSPRGKLYYGPYGAWKAMNKIGG
jgi:hypothetical protein